MSDGPDQGVKCSCGGLAKGCFELGENLFDWVEVGAVGREVAQRRAGPLDHFLDARDFVGGKIVHHDDIAGAQGWDEKMLDISQEARAIHRPIKHTGRGDPIMTKRGNECCCHPMAVRDGRDKALTARSASIKPCHIGLRPSFVNEDKMFRVQTGLACTPLVAGFGDIRAILFGGAQGLFLSVSPSCRSLFQRQPVLTWMACSATSQI